MQEDVYFLAPDAAEHSELPEEAAQYAYKVLKLNDGDEVMLIDGRGSFHRAVLTTVSQKSCSYEILQTLPQEKGWQGTVHLAIAPTKKMERMEWLAEKCTEIGIDALTFLDCHLSQRRSVHIDRVEKIVGDAVRESRKPFIPQLTDIVPFKDFVSQQNTGKKFICHCHEEVERAELLEECMLLTPTDDITILIGPEGDFTADEVRLAVQHGYKSVTLGTFRLRTETAGVMAVSMYNLASRNKKTT